MFKSLKVSKNTKLNRGFTLIEMIIVVAMIAIIAAISISQFVKNKQNSTVQNIAEELALNIRRAQSLALAVQPTGTGLGSFQNGYGIYLDLNKSNSYDLFVDFESTPGTGGWDHAYKNNTTGCGSPSITNHECLEKISFTSADFIESLELCNTTCTTLDSSNPLAITFLRPNLDAYFCTTSYSNGGCSSSTPAGYVKINVSSPSNEKVKTVLVWSTGQISIE